MFGLGIESDPMPLRPYQLHRCPKDGQERDVLRGEEHYEPPESSIDWYVDDLKGWGYTMKIWTYERYS